MAARRTTRRKKPPEQAVLRSEHKARRLTGSGGALLVSGQKTPPGLCGAPDGGQEDAVPDGSLHGIRGDRSAGEEDPVGHVDHAIAGVNIGLDHIGRATGFIGNHDGLTVE